MSELPPLVVRDLVASMSPAHCHCDGPGCWTRWQCFHGNASHVPYIPESLVLANSVDGANVTTESILGYMIRFEPFMMALMGSILQRTCHSDGGLKPVFVDSGANEGFWSLLAGSYGCHVIAVEPQPGCHTWIKRSLALNPHAMRHVHLWPHFLSPDHNMTLNITSDTCIGGETFAADVPSVASIKRAAAPKSSRVDANDPGTLTTSVSAARLDAHAYFGAHSDARVALWHVDTEGAEVPVLRSASALFESERIDRVVIEVHPWEWSKYHVSLASGYAEFIERFGSWDCIWACTGQRINWVAEASRVAAQMRHGHRGHGGYCNPLWSAFSPRGGPRASAVDAFCVRPGVDANTETAFSTQPKNLSEAQPHVQNAVTVTE